jgi:hypothetical protein
MNSTLIALGNNSRSNCNSFGPSSTVKLAMPVRFAPGLLRLATRPNATGSPPETKTIGMVAVAAFAAKAAVVLPAAITATRRRTRSAVRTGSRSNWFSAQRYSIATFWPST